MNISGHDVGVCSWSLRPRDMADLVAQVRSVGLEHMQLALIDLVMADDKRKAGELSHLRASGIKLTGGMMNFPGEDYSTIAMIRETGGFLPDSTWETRRALMLQGGKVAAELGVELITSHVGFIPASNQGGYQVAIERIRELANGLGELGVGLLMETGQEPAHELLQVLNDLAVRNVHINFDPANMILYGAGDPIDAVMTLGRHIRHVHVKDATLSAQPGVKWGEEVPFGTGEVDPREFLAALKAVGYAGALAIEREAGEQRLADVAFAVETLKNTPV
jgi:L-ribulose-5-phosphate 3-epimerase